MGVRSKSMTGDGADPGAKLNWEATVRAGQRLTTQERNAGKAYDVIQAGEEVTVTYRGDDFTAIIEKGTVTPEYA